MFLDVKDLAVRKLRIRKTYAPGSVDFHSSEIKQLDPLEVTATAELLEGQIRVEGQLDTKIELQCARCLEPVVEEVNRAFDLFYAPLPKDEKPKEDRRCAWVGSGTARSSASAAGSIATTPRRG